MTDPSVEVEEILATHHAYLYRVMPELDAAFSAAGPALRGAWDALVAELEPHLEMEEEMLFPAILAGEGGLETPLALMVEQHERIRACERRLRGLSREAGEHEAALIQLLDDLAVHAAREDHNLAGV